MCHVDDEVPEAAYFPPAEVMRSIRDYHGGVQQLSHIWSFVINFNALASLTMAIEEDVNAGTGKSRLPDPVTMAALRPGAMLLEREDASLLTEELKVERDKDTGAAKPKSMMKVISWLRKKDKDTVEITNRVALHDIVNQERFTAGLTITGSEGIDAWARVGEDKVVLFQSKGQQKGSAVGQPGNNAVLTPKDLHDYIASLMLSAYTSADDLVKHKIRAVCTAKSEETRADCQTQLVDSIRTWLKWSETKVMAELLLVPHLSPRTSSKTKEELPQKFRGEIITDFNDKRRKAKKALLAELSKVTCDGVSDELSGAVSELKTALDPRITKQHVPSVVVVFRDRFDTALGDVFGGIVSRTVERPKEEEEEESKSGRESDGA